MSKSNKHKVTSLANSINKFISQYESALKFYSYLLPEGHRTGSTNVEQNVAYEKIV